ncbi:MMPL family transporter [Nocardioides sp.]|uniref:MMPL family transporter n=1 Tax=Nocardioides sp. TaxID=35761 RepID=UPI00356812D3
MFAFLGRSAARRPWWTIAGWVIAAALVIVLAPKFEATTDQSDFLPRDYESIRALDLQAKAFPDQTSPGAVVVFDRVDGAKLKRQDLAIIDEVVTSVGSQLGPAFGGMQVQPPSENGLIQIAPVSLADGTNAFDDSQFDSVPQLRDDLDAALAGTDINAGVTGRLAQGYDNQQSSEAGLQIVAIATILLILVLLALIFRSVLICLLPILVVVPVSFVVNGLIATANEMFNLKAGSEVEAVLIVVLFGIGTDYILFFLFRYRERLREGEDKRAAVEHALERAGEAIASAGGAVIVAFLALTLSSLGIFKSMGPALAIAVFVTLLAALTLVPSVVTVLGRALFWPSKKYMVEPEAARFAALGRSLGKHPVRYIGASGGVLAFLTIFAFGFQPSFDLASSSTSSDADSIVSLKTLEKGYPAGATDPTIVLLNSTDGDPLTEEQTGAFLAELQGVPGLAQAVPVAVSQDGLTASYAAYLADNPSSDAAADTVRGPLRTTVHEAAGEGAEGVVGGTTSIFVDFGAAMSRDYKVVFPVAAIAIMIILALLLRSLVAPLYLMASVGLGFGATIGAAVLVFQHIGGADGLVFLLPIYIYLFVVAIGTDYNILMIARLREEAREGLNARDAAAQALKHAGPTVAAAGVILAGTFASLILAGNSLLISMGFSISFGIFMAAFVMAMFFTPAITALIGHAAWWPGHGDEPESTDESDDQVRVDALT